MNEKEFASKVARLLQSGLKDIDDATCAKLKAARRVAMEHYQESAKEPSLALAGPGGGRFGNLFGQRTLLWAPLIAALIVLAIGGYLHYAQNEADDVDVFLLSGELPIHAYIDKDFDAWLKGYSR